MAAEIYVKQHHEHFYKLQSYTDYSVKIITQKKINGNAMLAKAYPTSKRCDKYLLNSYIEVKKEHIPSLLNILNKINIQQKNEQVFFEVVKFENWKKQKCRLVVRSNSWEGLEICYQHQDNEIPDDDEMVFDQDPQPTSINNLQGGPSSSSLVEESWVDDWGSFHIKKNDSLNEYIIAIRKYNHDTNPKQQVTTKKRVVKKKKMLTLNFDDDDDDTPENEKKKIKIESDDDEVEKEINPIYSNLLSEVEENNLNLPPIVLSEIMYYRYKCCKSMQYTLCLYGDTINKELACEDIIVDFMSILRDKKLVGELEELYTLLLKKNNLS